MKGIAWVLVLLALWVPAAHAVTAEETLATVAFDQRIGSPLPRAALLSLEAGRLTLAELSEDQPLVLVLSWFECPNLCPMVLDQLAAAARRLPFEPGDYQVAVVSIDPGEGAGEARTLKARLRAEHGAVVADWQFLWGDRQAIARLAETVGFRYAYDAADDRYAHPSGAVIATPGGRISHYLLQLRPEAPDLRLALMEASAGELGNPVQQALLRCYRFDPETGRYNLAVTRLVQVAGGVSLLGLSGLVFWLRRREVS